MTTSATTVIATDIGPPEPFTIEGNLTTRILPKSWLEYEHMKPRDRRLLDTVAWRLRIEYPQDETWITGISSTQVAHEDEIVLLDIDLQIPRMDPEILQVSNGFVSSKVGLQREANETVYRSLRRLEISLHKKLYSIYCSTPPTTNAHRRRGSSSSSISTMQDLKSSILVSLDDGMSLEDGGDSISIGGTNKFEVEIDHDNKSMWLDLMEMPRSYLWIDEPIANVTGVMLTIDPCPPTLLFVHTFEDFAAEVFVGVPLVLEIGVVHAKGALVVWFVNETQVAFNSMTYTPKDIDFGKSITVLISPIRNNMREGLEEVYQFASTVRERPVMPLLDRRSCWLAQHAGANNRLRVLSYNLMADIHLSPEVDRRANYARCNPSVLARTRRIPLLLYEILQHEADIVCLQEVDATVYESLLRPAMAVHGYDSFYTNKATLQLEGAAMFWSRSKFENEADMEDYAIRDLFHLSGSFDNDDWDSMREIRDFLKGRPDLHQVVEGRIGQVLQIARLRPKFGSKHPIVVGNTHLFYHPLADHIRLMQTFVVCRTLDAWCQRNPDKGWRDQLLLCGDLNSDPRSGAVQLLVNRKVTPGNCDTWKCLDESTSGMMAK